MYYLYSSSNISIEKKGGPIEEYDEEMEMLNGLLNNGREPGEKCVAAKIAERRAQKK